MSIYPEHKWKLSQFKDTKGIPVMLLTLVQRRRKWLDHLAITLKLENWEDWYSVTTKDVVDHGGRSLLNKYHGSMFMLLRSSYPEHSWEQIKFVDHQTNNN
jgi:hypothetical protein